MKTKYFIPFCLILIFGIHFAFMNFKMFFSSGSLISEELVQTRTKLEKEKLKTEVAYYELESLRQQVAINLPGNILPKEYPVRNLASITRSNVKNPLSQFEGDRLFREGKAYFRQKDYIKSNELLSNLILNYRYSPHLPEAYFLLIEGFYQIEDFETCLEELDVMINQFPDNELTGYAMLRMGQIFEKRERLDDAKSIYQSVIQSFKNKELKKQAQILFDGLSL